VAMAAELGGTCLLDGANPVRVTPLLPPPAGVLSPGELVGALAKEAGAAAPDIPSAVDPPARIEAERPAAARRWDDPPPPVLLLNRQACDSGCGALTGHGSWQRGVTESAELRLSADCAREANLKNLSEVVVQVGDLSLRGRARIAPELTDGVIVFPEGLPQGRALLPSRIDDESGIVVSEPVSLPTESLK
jgi:hypothetical protein